MGCAASTVAGANPPTSAPFNHAQPLKEGMEKAVAPGQQPAIVGSDALAMAALMDGSLSPDGFGSNAGASPGAHGGTASLRKVSETGFVFWSKEPKDLDMASHEEPLTVTATDPSTGLPLKRKNARSSMELSEAMAARMSIELNVQLGEVPGLQPVTAHQQQEDAKKALGL